MTFVKQMNHSDEAINQESHSPVAGKPQSLLSSFSDYGWSIDSIAHLVLFVPFTAAIILTLSALDWGAIATV